MNRIIKEYNSYGLPVMFLFFLITGISCNKDNHVVPSHELLDQNGSASQFSDSTVTDYDGNVYIIKQFGDLIWMTENLIVTHYADGGPIPKVEDVNTWRWLYTKDYHDQKAFCYYNNNANGEADIYGALYTWSAAMNGEESSNRIPSNIQGVCPNGWHLPSDNEWIKLFMFLGMSYNDASSWGFNGSDQGSQLADNKNLWQEGELSSNHAFGSTGFKGLPGGLRTEYGPFGDIQQYGIWWSSTRDSETEDYAITRSLFYDNSKTDRSYKYITAGLSVRCVKSAAPETVTDSEGNIYTIVNLGKQKWLAENLRSTKYTNGYAIPKVDDNSQWALLDTTDKAYCTNSDSHFPPDSSYGNLYTWAAAVGYDVNTNDSYIQGICPDGWHIPSDDEWKYLEMYFGMSVSDADKEGFRDLHHHVGSKLAGNHAAWYDSFLEDNDGFNISGFKAEGAGFRNYHDGLLQPMYYDGFWWTSTETNMGRAMCRNITTRLTKINRKDFNKANGFSVRCLKND